MSHGIRILNISRGYTLKQKQALRAIENCACAWVDFGKTIRDLTFAEAITARNKQATQREPLELTEVHGLRYEPAASGIAQTREGFGLSREANQFYTQAVYGNGCPMLES